MMLRVFTAIARRCTVEFEVTTHGMRVSGSGVVGVLGVVVLLIFIALVARPSWLPL
jgi:hypothetical protein